MKDLSCCYLIFLLGSASSVSLRFLSWMILHKSQADVLIVCFLWYKLGKNTCSSGAVLVKGGDIWQLPSTRVTQVFYNASRPWIFLGFFTRCIFGRREEYVSFWGDCVDPKADDFARSLLVWSRCLISDSQAFIKTTCSVLVIEFTLRPSFFFPLISSDCKGKSLGLISIKNFGLILSFPWVNRP